VPLESRPCGRAPQVRRCLFRPPHRRFTGFISIRPDGKVIGKGRTAKHRDNSMSLLVTMNLLNNRRTFPPTENEVILKMVPKPLGDFEPCEQEYLTKDMQL